MDGFFFQMFAFLELT